MYYIGFDIGGTKIEAMLIHYGTLSSSVKPIQEFQFQKKTEEIIPAYILNKKRVATDRHRGYEQIIDKMAQLAFDVCEYHNVKLTDLSGVGLSVPGPVHPVSKKVLVSNSMIVVNHNLHEDLNQKLKLSCPFLWVRN
jgi:predicted NBD/HSP70 family sugar kinase